MNNLTSLIAIQWQHACVAAVKEIQNYYDIRNQLMNSIDAEAKTKNSAFVASIQTTPLGVHSYQSHDLMMIMMSSVYFLHSVIGDSNG